MLITIRELNHLNTLLKDIYRYFDNVDIDNGYITIYFTKDNPNNALKYVMPYENEDLKNLLKKLIKVLDIEFNMW